MLLLCQLHATTATPTVRSKTIAVHHPAVVPHHSPFAARIEKKRGTPKRTVATKMEPKPAPQIANASHANNTALAMTDCAVAATATTSGRLARIESLMA